MRKVSKYEENLNLKKSQLAKYQNSEASFVKFNYKYKIQI